jgi:polygalacturonase
MELMNYSPLVYAYGEENIALTGSGTLDGQASETSWWPWKGAWKTHAEWASVPNQLAARARLIDMVEHGVPVAQRVFGEGDHLRPQFIQPYGCRNVLIEGVTLLRAPMWQVHPVLCTNVTVRGLHISSHGPNNDGCNPESCRDVLIENTYFDTGDDCIAIKSGRNADGRRLAVPSENIVIRNCRMKDGHGGVTIGSEMSGGVRNVFVESCDMDSPELERALRLKTNALRGGFI